MTVTLALHNVVYIIISLVCLAFLIANLLDSYSGLFTPGKRKYELGFDGIIAIFAWLIFSLIFGGIFWW